MITTLTLSLLLSSQWDQLSIDDAVSCMQIRLSKCAVDSFLFSSASLSYSSHGILDVFGCTSGCFKHKTLPAPELHGLLTNDMESSWCSERFQRKANGNPEELSRNPIDQNLSRQNQKHVFTFWSPDVSFPCLAPTNVRKTHQRSFQVLSATKEGT